MVSIRVDPCRPGQPHPFHVDIASIGAGGLAALADHLTTHGPVLGTLAGPLAGCAARLRHFQPLGDTPHSGDVRLSP